MRVARPGKGRETVRTEAVGLQPGRSVTSTTEILQLREVSTYRKRAVAGRRGRQVNSANDNVSRSTE